MKLMDEYTHSHKQYVSGRVSVNSSHTEDSTNSRALIESLPQVEPTDISEIFP